MSSKLIGVLIVIVFFVSTALSNSFYVGGVFYKNGALTTPDSIHIAASFRPSLSTANYLLIPSSGVYDSLISIPTNNDAEVNLVYAVFFNTDSVMVSETVRLKFDSANFIGNYWTTLSDSARREIERDGGHLASIAYFWGACDNCVQQYFPVDGTTPKDSVQIKSSAGVLLMSILYKHSNSTNVLDSTVVIHQVP